MSIEILADKAHPAIPILGIPITALPFKEQIDLIISWSHQRRSKVVCVANTHMLVEATKDNLFKEILLNADMATPDGMPLVWMLKLLGMFKQDRVAGMDIFEAVCQQASLRQISFYLVGSHPKILERIKIRLKQEFPKAKLAGIESLPFAEYIRNDDELVKRINDSGAGVVFVSLGCPKQERWMSAHKDKINAVMIGVGAVFPIYAGIQSRAPKLMRHLGFEWLYRLLQEPQRLWKRYVSTIPVFIVFAMRQLLQIGIGQMDFRKDTY